MIFTELAGDFTGYNCDEQRAVEFVEATKRKNIRIMYL